MKVILETGRLAEPARIAAAARAAIMGGCDMLETSTGMFPVGATLEAAAVLLAVIEAGRPDRHQVFRRHPHHPAGGAVSLSRRPFPGLGLDLARHAPVRSLRSAR